MTTLLQSGAAWLAGQLKTHAAIDVSYERSGDVCEVSAVQGSTPWDVIDSGGAPVRFISCDWRLTAADLVLAGLIATPEAGDKIVDRNGEQVLTYEVLPPDGKNCFERLPQGVELIVYSKLISSE